MRKGWGDDPRENLGDRHLRVLNLEHSGHQAGNEP
jgi:hypothetical protein